MMIPYRLAACLLTIGLTINSSHAAPPSHGLNAIDLLVLDSMRNWNVPGAAAVVVRGDCIVTLSGYGTKKHGTLDPVSPNTVFPLASCSKAFTTTLIAMLVDEGVLGWDDPVRKHLPGFRLSDPPADALVTLRDIVSHRTGVAGHDLLWYHAPWDLDDVIRRSAWLPVEKPFRGAFQYSSIMVAAAGRAVANRTDRPWHELVRERITGPLGMSGVTFTTTEQTFKSADLPTGYRRTRSGLLEPMPRYEISEPNPAGSIHCTPRDMVPWLQFHLAGGMHAGKSLVTPVTLDETKTPQISVRMDSTLRRMNPDTVQMSYGMGWLIYDYRGKRIYAHGGKIDGFRTHIALMPDEQIGIALFHNVHDINMNQALCNKIVDCLLGLPAKDWDSLFLAIARDEEAEKRAAADKRSKERKADLKPSLALAEYAGQYQEPAYGTAKVQYENGKLTWEWSTFRCPLEHWEGNVFRIVGGFFEDQFVEFRTLNGKADAARFVGRVFVRGE